ncbi:S8 family serine peptidase [Dyella sp. 2RAB6]|uniref:S8 family serine peptidase n=1 Tax=Dyella sp. 2RAB6 TaxID=3232992 RepID=UPI003F8F9A4C
MQDRRKLYFASLILLGAGSAACAANLPGRSIVMADTDTDTTAPTEPHAATRVQLIVSFREGTPLETMRVACDAAGATYVRDLGWAPAIVVQLPEGMSAEEGMVRFRAQPGVINVEVDGKVRAAPIRGPSISK